MERNGRGGPIVTAWGTVVNANVPCLARVQADPFRHLS